MGANKALGGFRDGELPLDAGVLNNSVTYYGGQPASIVVASGGLTLTKSGATSYLGGVFANSSYEDVQNGNGTILYGGSKITLINGSNNVDTTIPGVGTVEGAPYDTTQTYAYGDLLYITAAGLWTNQSASGIGTNGAAASAKAIVLNPATANNGNMDIYLLPTF